MKRFAAFDPPEYVDWTADPEVIEAFRRCPEAHEERRPIIAALAPEQHLALYKGLVRNRLYDIMLKRWVRQGVLSKAWLGTGEEAVTIGAVHALDNGDVVGPMIRNAGAYHEKGLRLMEMFAAYLGTRDSPTRGKDLHLGELKHGVVAPISMVGSLVPVCAGVALSFKMRGEPRVALTWAGDGTTRTAGFHEGMVCARTLKVPLIVIIQDNQIAMGTVHKGQSRLPPEEIASVYGLEALKCDGNHVLDVYAATRQAAEQCRRGDGPVLLAAKTFRMGGHATHDEGESREIFPEEVLAYWGKRDPLGLYETYLMESDLPLAEEMSNAAALERAVEEVEREIDEAAEAALASQRGNMPTEEDLERGVYGEPQG